MREFYLSQLQYNKWEYQQRENKKECCWCEHMYDELKSLENEKEVDRC